MSSRNKNPRRNFKHLDFESLKQLRRQLKRDIENIINDDDMSINRLNGIRIRLKNSRQYPDSMISEEMKNYKAQIDDKKRSKLKDKMRELLAEPRYGASKVALKTKLRQLNFPAGMIDQEMKNVPSFQQHRKQNMRIQRGNHRKIRSSAKGSFIQMDTAVLPARWFHDNIKNHQYILCVVDVFTRYAYARHMRTKDEYLPAFRHILQIMNKEHRYNPKNLVSDNEFIKIWLRMKE